jgi:hypothetical protein
MKTISEILLSTILCLTISSQAKVLIFTYSYNRPDFIEIQHKTFQKFLLDDYEFLVFNDATNDDMCTQIEQMCQKYAIRCIRIPQEIHGSVYNPSVRNCTVVNYSLNLIGFDHDDIVALVDSDMFLIKEFSIRNYLKDFDLAGLDQIRGSINYLWIGLVFLNMATMPNKNTLNFNCGAVENTQTDSGGYTYYYLKNNPNARTKYFNGTLYLDGFCCNYCRQDNQFTCLHNTFKMQEYNFSQPLITLAQQGRDSIMELYLYNTFLHYRAGSNWNQASAEYIQRKTLLLKQFIQKLLAI